VLGHAQRSAVFRHRDEETIIASPRGDLLVDRRVSLGEVLLGERSRGVLEDVVSILDRALESLEERQDRDGGLSALATNSDLAAISGNATDVRHHPRYSLGDAQEPDGPLGRDAMLSFSFTRDTSERATVIHE
jgi:hypothetical protein